MLKKQDLYLCVRSTRRFQLCVYYVRTSYVTFGFTVSFGCLLRFLGVYTRFSSRKQLLPDFPDSPKLFPLLLRLLDACVRVSFACLLGFLGCFSGIFGCFSGKIGV